jgi:leader peptidase (prepilin peptidase)/N-methyltransferase
MLLGGVVAFAVMFVLFMVLPGFGFGDVRLAGLVGLLAGIGLLLNTLMVAAIAAGVGAGFMLVTRRVGRRGVIAYGPYLALGAFWAMLAG